MNSFPVQTHVDATATGLKTVYYETGESRTSLYKICLILSAYEFCIVLTHFSVQMHFGEFAKVWNAICLKKGGKGGQTI